jgi:uncharacterized protein
MYVEEAGADEVADLWDTSDRIFCLAVGYLEVRGAIARRLARAAARRARDILDEDRAEVETIEVDDSLIARASEVTDLHRLRALDALHLAAAVELGHPELVVATWDKHLARAVRAEGLALAPTE